MAIKRDSVKEIHQMIEALHGQIRAVRTTLDCDEFFDRQVAYLRKQVDQAQASLDRLLYTREHGEEIIAGYHEEIARLRKRKKIAAHRQKIEQLLRLQQQVDALEQEESRCEARLYVGDGEWKRCPNDREVEVECVPPDADRVRRKLHLCKSCARRVKRQTSGHPWWYAKK